MVQSLREKTEQILTNLDYYINREWGDESAIPFGNTLQDFKLLLYSYDPNFPILHCLSEIEDRKKKLSNHFDDSHDHNKLRNAVNNFIRHLDKISEEMKGYIEKSEALLGIFSDFKNQEDIDIMTSVKANYPLTKAELEFKHLVYSYDMNLPLNVHLSEIDFPHGYFPSKSKVDKCIQHIEFFISYLKNELKEIS